MSNFALLFIDRNDLNINKPIIPPTFALHVIKCANMFIASPISLVNVTELTDRSEHWHQHQLLKMSNVFYWNLSQLRHQYTLVEILTCKPRRKARVAVDFYGIFRGVQVYCSIVFVRFVFRSVFFGCNLSKKHLIKLFKF